MKNTLGILTILLLAAYPAAAQSPWAVDIRGGAAFPVEELGDVELDTGGGLGATLSWQVQPEFALYGGWDWANFTTGEPLGGVEVDVEMTGYNFGVRFERPAHPALGNLRYRIGAGGLFSHIEVEDDDGELVDDSEHGLGFEVEAGLLIPVGMQWTLVPGARFRSLSRDLELVEVELPVDLRYIQAEVGLQFTF